MIKEYRRLLFMISLASIMLVALGVFGTLAFQGIQDLKDEQSFLDGMRFVGEYNQMEALKFAESQDSGDWVCVNVKGMKFDRAVEVCQHEVGHEIFAEVCEKDMDKCLGVLNE